VTQSRCEAAGLAAYEVSNHAKEGQESRHNLIYWASGDWAGIGPGAHGRLTLEDGRVETVAAKAPGAWIERVEAGGTGDVVFERLSETDVLEERILMGLRLVDGIKMPKRWVAENINKINALSDIKLLDLDQQSLQVSPKGRPLLNSVINQLLTD